MNPRERNMVLALGGVALLFVGRWIVMDVVLGPVRERHTRLERLDADLERKRFEIKSQQLAADQLKKWKESALSSDPNAGTSVLYRGYLTELLTKAGIKNQNVQPGAVRQMRDAYQLLTFTVDAECDLTKLAKLLYEFQRTDLLHAIKSIDVRPQITNDKIDHFVAKLDVEVLAFNDAAAKEKLVPGGKSDGKKVDDFKLFVDKNFFQPTNVVDRDRIVRSDRDDRPNVKFHGISRADGGSPTFHFYNSSTNKPMELKVGEVIDIAQMKAKIMGFDTEAGVLLEVGGKVGAVRSGQALSTWKETSKRTAVLNLASQPTL